MNKITSALITVFLILSINVQSQDTGLYKYSVGDFEFIYYGNGYSYLIPHSAKSFTNAFNAHKRIFNYKQNGKIAVFVNDFTDFGSGGAVAIPFNFIMFCPNPFDNVYENMPSNERIIWLASHELTHIVMCDKPGSSENFFRNIFFGKPVNDNSNPLSLIYSYLASKRWYSPRWFHEGIAIFMETVMNGGSGRMLGGFDEMMFRTMVLDSSIFYKPVGLETEGSTIDFMVGANAYLYGTRFVSYLASNFGVDKLMDFYTRSDSSYGFFGSQFKKVYGNDLQTVWDNWIDIERKFQKDNLNLIRKNPITKQINITDKILGSSSRQFYDKKRNSIITAINYPGKLAHIAEINLSNGSIREIAPVMSPRLYFVTNIAYNESTGTIFITENNNNYRDLVMIDIETGDIIKRNEFIRFGEPVINKADNSLWGVRNYNGRSIISRMLPPYDNVEEFYTIPFGYQFFDLDISPDGEQLSGTYADPNGIQKIVIFQIKDLIQGINQFNEIYEFEDNTASNFTFSSDGKNLFGTSYITGVSNIFRINIANKSAEILTNVESGYFRPLQINKDTLVAFNYTAKGLLPVKIGIDTVNVEPINLLGMNVFKRNPELYDWKLPSISTINIDSIGATKEDYSSIANTELAYIIPIVEGYQDFAAFGFKAKFIDKMYLNMLDLNLSYSFNDLIPEKERLHFYMKYNYWLWEFSAAWNKTDFYDLFGPTKRSREGGFLSLKYSDYLLPNRSPEKFDYDISGSYYFDLKTMPLYQNVKINADNLYSADFNLHYSVLRKSLGAIEEESGYEFKLSVSDDYIDKYNFLKLYGSATFGTLLPIRNSSVWLRLFAGKSFGEENHPFNYFYFGGFGNNYLDNNSVQRYRGLMSFAGTEINSISANSFSKATIEWNLPPYRFLNFGFLPAYITYSRVSLFASVLNNDISTIAQEHLFYNSGIQIDFELSLFYLLKTYLSFGYGGTFKYGHTPTDEFMISLKF